jgi:hypothetical protein
MGGMMTINHDHGSVFALPQCAKSIPLIKLPLEGLFLEKMGTKSNKKAQKAQIFVP